MEELIKIEEKDGQKLVSARELYVGLGFQIEDGNFSRWIKKQLESVDAIENEDFSRLVFKDGANNANVTDYVITIDIAKEICMVVGVSPRINEETKLLSKKFRRYFIECEKQLKQQPMLSEKEQLALKVFNGGIDAIEAHKQLVELETKPLKEEIEIKNQVISEYTPKVTYYDLVLQSKGTMTITQIAKDYGMSGRELNAKLHDLGIQYKQSDTWLLYSKYQGMGYTKSNTYVDNSGTSRLNTKWSQKGRLFIYDTLKKVNILPTIETEDVKVQNN